MSNDSTEKLTGGAVTEILARLDVMGKHLLSLESKVDGINSRLEAVETRLESLETKLNTLCDQESVS